ncbi:MAG: hypothetical protein NTU44_11590 [Bacteroidetes bacterium]|nr:hypothetical protein [Bacteroidota bacterium]
MKTSKVDEDLTYKNIMKMFRETRKDFKESQRRSKETDKQIKETDKQIKETDKQIKETDKMVKETSRQMKETDKKINKLEGFFSSQWGKFIESLVEGDLVKLLNNRNININFTSTSNKLLFQGKEYEFDILAVNADEIVVVEVKTNLKVEDIRWFLDKLTLFRTVFKKYETYQVYGAVAYLKATEAADKFAYRNGLFVIKATGNSAIINNDKEFVPRKF